MLGYEQLLFIERITVKTHRKRFPVASFILLMTEITRSLLCAYHLDTEGPMTRGFKCYSPFLSCCFTDKTFASFSLAHSKKEKQA